MEAWALDGGRSSLKMMVFFLEESSAKEMLEGLLPRVLPPEIACRYLVFQGKQDLEKNLLKRLRGWQHPDSVFVVIRDQDAGDCMEIKKRLAALCQQSGKSDVLVRVACHELESFYLGDLNAVEKGLDLGGISSQQDRRKFRLPDTIAHPSDELDKLTDGAYQKVAGSRAIAPHLNLSTNKSHSFNVLLEGIRKLAREIAS